MQLSGEGLERRAGSDVFGNAVIDAEVMDQLWRQQRREAGKESWEQSLAECVLL